MPSPTRKRVTDTVMQAVADAITAIANDPDVPRTKRQIEAITGRSHDAVARAFAQDRAENSAYKLNDRFNDLTANLTRGDSLYDAAVRSDRQTIAELRQQNRELHQRLDRFATALFARHVDNQAERSEIELITRIRRGKSGSA
jgi:predicted  nucleic acid-binding Zn-ribbon protein